MTDPVAGIDFEPGADLPYVAPNGSRFLRREQAETYWLRHELERTTGRVHTCGLCDGSGQWPGRDCPGCEGRGLVVRDLRAAQHFVVGPAPEGSEPGELVALPVAVLA